MKCEDCQGTGLENDNKVCPNCMGLGKLCSDEMVNSDINIEVKPIVKKKVGNTSLRKVIKKK